MSRRSGKAASRRARQRRAKSGAAPAPYRPAAPPSVVVAPDEPTEAAPEPRQPAPAVAPRALGGSRLGESAHLEYHYVFRDLRNIAVLVVVMVAALAAVDILVNVIGAAPH